MLNNKLHLFYAKLNEAVANHGTNAGAVTDAIIREAFPETVSAAEQEGADSMLRTGVHEFVSALFKRSPKHHPDQYSLEIPEPFQQIVSKLKGEAHYVEKLGNYVPVSLLIANPEWLDDARKYKRRKGEETIAEASVLDELYEAVTAAG